MPYWVEQTKGLVKDEIDEVVRAYKASEIDAETTWMRLCCIYEKTHSCREGPDWEEHRRRGQGHLDYMITTWFPFYANMWFSGYRNECIQKAAQLAYRHGGKFAVGYEY